MMFDRNSRIPLPRGLGAIVNNTVGTQVPWQPDNNPFNTNWRGSHYGPTALFNLTKQPLLPGMELPPYNGTVAPGLDGFGALDLQGNEVPDINLDGPIDSHYHDPVYDASGGQGAADGSSSGTVFGMSTPLLLALLVGGFALAA